MLISFDTLSFENECLQSRFCFTANAAVCAPSMSRHGERSSGRDPVASGANSVPVPGSSATLRAFDDALTDQDSGLPPASQLPGLPARGPDEYPRGKFAIHPPIKNAKHSSTCPVGSEQRHSQNLPHIEFSNYIQVRPGMVLGCPVQKTSRFMSARSSWASESSSTRRVTALAAHIQRAANSGCAVARNRRTGAGNVWRS